MPSLKVKAQKQEFDNRYAPSPARCNCREQLEKRSATIRRPAAARGYRPRVVTGPAIICMEEPCEQPGRKCACKLRNELKKMQATLAIPLLRTMNRRKPHLSDRIAVFNKGSSSRSARPMRYTLLSRRNCMQLLRRHINRLEGEVAAAMIPTRSQHHFVRLDASASTACDETSCGWTAVIDQPRVLRPVHKYYIHVAVKYHQGHRKERRHNLYEPGER